MSDIALSQPAPLAISRGNSKTGLRIVQSVCIFIIALVMISPLFMLLIASLKDDRFQILADMGSFRAFWVSEPTLSNYREIANFSGELAYGRYLFNSLVILVVTVVSGLVINSMAGFVLAWGSLRGKAVPMIDMRTVCRVPGSEPLESYANKQVIIVESDRKAIGLVVDELLDQHQVVIKSLEANFVKVPGMLGATILGDGTVSLILDVTTLGDVLFNDLPEVWHSEFVKLHQLLAQCLFDTFQ